MNPNSTQQQYVKRLVKQAQYWKCKYESLKIDYDKAQQLIKKKIDPQWPNQKNVNIQQTSFINQSRNTGTQVCLNIDEDEEEGNFQVNNQIAAKQNIHQSTFQKIKIANKSKNFDSIHIISEKQINFFEQEQMNSPSRSPKNNTNKDDQINFFSIEQIEKVQQESSKGMPLIQGYFIIQKIGQFQNNKKQYQKWIKTGNIQVMQKQKQMLQIVYRYSFQRSHIQKIEDDQFDSRKNQIRFGTPFEDLIYAFQDFSSDKKKLNLIKTSLKKRYVFCLIRPQLIQIDQDWYQTEILYGIISPFPFRGLFQDLHRAIQQQIKYELLKSQKSQTNQITMDKQKRIQAISSAMKEIFQKSTDNYSHIQNFPIQIKLSTKVMTLTLQIQNTQTFRKLQTECLLQLVRKYNYYQISQLLHYVLAQKQVVIVCKNRKNLNELFQIIRLMLLPFIWTFPIVYCYSSFFEGFLSSPMPLLIGVISQFPQKQKKQQIYLNSIPEHQFITIFVDKSQNQQKSQKIEEYYPKKNNIKAYQRNISLLFKYLNKKDKKSKTNIAERIQNYVNKLKKFIQSGVLNEQINQFYIQFMETQMVSFYKEACQGSAKKIKNKEPCQDSNTKNQNYQ